MTKEAKVTIRREYVFVSMAENAHLVAINEDITDQEMDVLIDEIHCPSCFKTNCYVIDWQVATEAGECDVMFCNDCYFTFGILFQIMGLNGPVAKEANDPGRLNGVHS